jgi:hypothetical protein
MTDFKEILDYDPATGIFRWRIAPPRRPFLLGERAGCLKPAGYRYIKIAQRNYPEHRLAWWHVYGAIPNGMELDHINGDPGDNRITNLRVVTKSVNLASRVVSPNRTGFRGVSLHQQTGLYRARIGRSTLGYFETPEAASKAYAEEALKIYGLRVRLL